MSRELTEEERAYINQLSTRSPMQAIRVSRLLKENSYRKGGRTIFFVTPEEKEKDTI